MIAALVVVTALSLSAATYDAAFWKTWSDGNAEVSTYRLTRTRYGEPREGVVRVVVVSEPWSKTGMVKDDNAKGSDRLPVLKLHTMTTFQTGIYDYSLATSAFVNLEPLNGMAPGNIIKVAFSSQELCGQVYHEVVDDGREGAEVVRSYFSGESLQRPVVRSKEPVLVEDALLLWARGLGGPARPSEGAVSVVFQPSLERSRLDHKPLALTTATIEPVGDKVFLRWRIRESSGRTTDVVVEPRTNQVRELSTSDGLRLELVASERLPYWKLNHVKDTAERARLQVPPLPLLEK